MFWFKRKPPSWLPPDYPVYEEPHVGIPWELTDAQAKENFEYFLQNKTLRIKALANLLTQFDIDLEAGLNAESPDELLTDLHKWSGDYWQQVPKSKTAIKLSSQTEKTNHWFTSHRSGDNLIYSVITDTGIVLGELLIRQLPSAYWSLVLDYEDIADKMLFARRYVVSVPWVDNPSHLGESDVLMQALDRYANPDSFEGKYVNSWLMSIHLDIESGFKGTLD